MSTNLRINHLAILVCFILLTGLGFLWYGPLFGDPWMEMVGLDAAQVEANPPGAGIWISNIIATILPLYVLAWLLIRMGVNTGIQGGGIGLLISFSFVFLSKMTGDLFAQNPYALSWITGGYDMASMTLAGFILGAWSKQEKSEG
jgi:hypothetical protein